MIRSPIASPPVPMFVVKSLSCVLVVLRAGPGPVISDRVCGTGTSGCRGRGAPCCGTPHGNRAGRSWDRARGRPLWFPLSPQVGFGRRECRIRGGDTSVDGNLEQDLDDLLRVDSDVAAGA